MKRTRFMPTHGAMAVDAAAFGLDFDIVVAAPDLFAAVGNAAVVTVRGPIMQHANWCWDSYEGIGERVDAAIASSATAIVLRINSPGGEVAGCFELSREIRAKAAAAGKRVYAYTEGMAASAGYALACAADTICAAPTAILGSVGVVKVAVDQTAMNRAMGLSFSVVTSGARKADGNPLVPMTEAGLGAIQREVDDMAGLFFALVGESRKSTPEKIASLEAATFVGAAAVAAGLADQVLTFDGLLAMVASGGTTAQVGAEDTTMTKREEAIAALKAMAAGDDEKDKKDAESALADMGEGEADGEEKPKDEAKADDEPAGDDEKPKDEKKDEATAAASASLALASEVQTLRARLDKKEAKEEREKLMASRPDLDATVVAFLAKQPLSTVRDAVKTLPKGSAKSQVAAARAALAVQGTIGATEGTRSEDPEAEKQRKEMDRQMGLNQGANAIRNTGVWQEIGVMTPSQARAELARRNGASK